MPMFEPALCQLCIGHKENLMEGGPLPFAMTGPINFGAFAGRMPVWVDQRNLYLFYSLENDHLNFSKILGKGVACTKQGCF